MKKSICFLLAIVMLFSMSACGTKTAPEAEQNSERTVLDHNGNTVTLPDEINRIVVCDIYPLPSVLSVFFDSAEKLVGIPMPSMAAAKNGLLGELYPEILSAETGFIDGSNINMEELLKLEPDIVFYSSAHPEQGEQLTKLGIAAVAVSADKWQYNAIETLNNWISLLSEIFPANDKAEKVKEYSESVYELVQKRVSDIPENERERAFFLFQYDETNLMTSGKQFFGQWWADAIGAVNVAGELESDKSVAVNMEQVYAWNPSLIFVTNYTPSMPDDLYNNTVGVYDWSEIDAVKSQNVFKMPLGMYRSYTAGVDTPITLLWLAKAAYPELFEDIDITAEAKEYYKDVFGIELSDAQANSIFSPPAEASAY